MTRRACPPGSIDGRFLKDLSFIRSYVIQDGDLFLATMADGAILRFVPYQTVAPAFECSNAEGTVEQMLCRDSELAQLDQDLEALYQQALKIATPAQQLPAMQRSWIKGRNECWKSEDARECVVTEYVLRTLALKKLSGAAISPDPVAFSYDDGSNITMYLDKRPRPVVAVFQRGDTRFTVTFR